MRTSRLTRTDQKRRVLGLFELVQLKARMGGVHLKIEGSGFNGLLLFRGEAREAIGERIGDPKVHRRSDQDTRKTFMTSSPR